MTNKPIKVNCVPTRQRGLEMCDVVTKCEPILPNVEALVEDLKRSNNLKAFILAIRRGFVQNAAAL